MSLKPRLNTIIKLIEPVDTIVDVGTDHGHLSIELIRESKAKRIIATDVNELPLLNAKQNIEFALKNKIIDDSIELRISDGLQKISPGEAKAAIIAGMGGDLIVKILDDSKETALSLDYIILQPQRAGEKVRAWLIQNGFEIVDEISVKDNDKFYDIIKAKVGIHREEVSDVFLELGLSLEERSLLQDKKDYEEYLYSRMKSLEKSINGLKSSSKLKTKESELEIKRKSIILHHLQKFFIL